MVNTNNSFRFQNFFILLFNIRNNTRHKDDDINLYGKDFSFYSLWDSSTVIFFCKLINISQVINFIDIVVRSSLNGFSFIAQSWFAENSLEKNIQRGAATIHKYRRKKSKISSQKLKYTFVHFTNWWFLSKRFGWWKVFHSSFFILYFILSFSLNFSFLIPLA